MTCLACASDQWTVNRVLPRLGVRTCLGCGLLTSEIDAPGAVSYSDFDQEAYDGAIGRLRRKQAFDVLRFARRYVRVGEWLDIGCGPGYLLAEAASVGFQVTGI